MRLSEVSTPALLVDRQKMMANLRRMQMQCDSAGVELWPHIKTHKMAEALRLQIELGAKGATCSKLGEAESLLSSGVRRVFIAHSLVDPAAIPRINRLRESLDELVLAVTSLPHCEALEALLAEVGGRFPILLAVDTGLRREGVRTVEEALATASRIKNSPHMQLIGLYSHEGHAYHCTKAETLAAVTDEAHRILTEVRDALGGNLPLWPGCSVTAYTMMKKPFVKVIRPGAYIFGDLSHTETTGILPFADVSLTIYATVVDTPTRDLALIDAGSKVFSGDKTPALISGRCVEFPSLVVSRVSEEHGCITGEGVEKLRIGQRLQFVPAHVCPVVNLADRVRVVDGGVVGDTWKVDGRGRSD